MENATHALIIVFAVFVFVLALTVSIVSFSNAKNAADIILYTKDQTNYYNYTKVSGKADENRIVGLETIIPTLYKYYKENYTIVFKHCSSYTNGEFSDDLTYLPVYNADTTKNWNSTYLDHMKNKYNPSDETGIKNLIRNGNIFSFDQDEEILRNELWTGSQDRAKINIDCFLFGLTYKDPTVPSGSLYARNMEYGKVGNKPGPGGFIGNYSNKKFVETVEEYTPTGIDESYNDQLGDDASRSRNLSSSTKDKSKRMIIFTLADSIN